MGLLGMEPVYLDCIRIKRIGMVHNISLRRKLETPPVYVHSSRIKSHVQNTGEVGCVEKGWPIKHGNIGHIRPHQPF